MGDSPGSWSSEEDMPTFPPREESTREESTRDVPRVSINPPIMFNSLLPTGNGNGNGNGNGGDLVGPLTKKLGGIDIGSTMPAVTPVFKPSSPSRGRPGSPSRGRPGSPSRGRPGSPSPSRRGNRSRSRDRPPIRTESVGKYSFKTLYDMNKFGKVMGRYRRQIRRVSSKGVYFNTVFGVRRLRDNKRGLYLKAGGKKWYLHLFGKKKRD